MDRRGYLRTPEHRYNLERCNVGIQGSTGKDAAGGEIPLHAFASVGKRRDESSNLIATGGSGTGEGRGSETALKYF
ncbi:hypothetical protein TRIP_E280096 [uncultured Spirochaetota bacterium]|nr:hypothetical protein TRIP_E280096 [uncultured Spirochaetota bacterium]